MIEHFKPAGHKAPNFTTAITLEETFKPIQRVTHNDKTIGYLFRDVEYRPGRIEDIVLGYEVFRYKTRKNIYQSLPHWTTYLANKENNPYGFIVPSGPLMMELTYRTAHDKSTLHHEVNQNIRTTYQEWPVFNTIIHYHENTVHHQHLDGTTEPQSTIIPEREYTILSEDNDTTTQVFLSAILGRRAPHANTIFGTDATPVELEIPPKNVQTFERALVLGVSNYDDRFTINADYDVISSRAARGVGLAARILNIRGVDVHSNLASSSGEIWTHLL